jgi:hypothetical protein
MEVDAGEEEEGGKGISSDSPIAVCKKLLIKWDNWVTERDEGVQQSPDYLTLFPLFMNWADSADASGGFLPLCSKFPFNGF